MMPDKAKKYKFAGLTFEFDPLSCMWRGKEAGFRVRLSVTDTELSYQVEQGNAQEIREPREFKTTGTSSHIGRKYVALDDELPDWAFGATSPLEVTIREVLK